MVNSQTNWGLLYIDKNSVHIMVFEVVTSDGDVMVPFIFRLNMKAYIKCL